MNDEPIMIDETEDFGQPRRSTRRSWSLFRWIVAGVATLLVTSLVTADRWSDTFGGATASQIAEFEQAMSDYFDLAKSRDLTQVTMQHSNTLQANAYTLTAEKEAGTYAARERVSELIGAMNSSNSQKATAQFDLRVRAYNGDKVIPADVAAEGWPGEGRPWVMRSITAGVWLAFKTALITFVAARLLLKLCELLWWFLMDRLRDVAHAVCNR